MTTILLINPNTSRRSTAMMLAVAKPHLHHGTTIRGRTADRGPGMIVDEPALAEAAEAVVRIGLAEEPDVDALVVAAFGDPGVERLRALLSVPVIGIGEAAIEEAAIRRTDGRTRRFGIATTTPALVQAIEALVTRLGLRHLLTGVRAPDADPLSLAADPARQEEALARSVRDCLELDGAEAVVIGGGPLSETAARLASRFAAPIVEPVPAAVRALRAAVSPSRRSCMS